MKEILINSDILEKRVAIIEDGKLEEFYLERPEDKTIVGNIYKGRVDSVVRSLNAAFVDIGQEKKGFLYLTEVESQPRSLELKKNDEVLVQVVKEAYGKKGPRLSCEISLAGRYLVLMPNGLRIGISRRITEEEERRRLRQIISQLKFPGNVGFIIRTVASGQSDKGAFLRDARALLKLWHQIKKQTKKAAAPSLLCEEYDLVLRIMRDSFSEEIDNVWVDSKAEYRRIQSFIRTFLGGLARRLHFYRDKELFEERGIEQQIAKIFADRVYLKSKGYLVIEPTEGLVVIDVNSGSFKKNISPEEAAFRVNCEAAVEAARQLRLRDLGGIIVIDFIDMEKEAHRCKIYEILRKELSKDSAKYDCLGISKFGLVELTRQRIHDTIQMHTHRSCPYCAGHGKIKSTRTVSILALRLLSRHLEKEKVREVNLTVNPEVYALISEQQDYLRTLYYKFRSKINLISNPTLHLEEIKID
ncbi:MAG: Rne/Rng family ribonuclease [Candidatus Omnitrophica bacterium]|nr:Rne/Rng family ribonuclease [Candidatus Omnitrophota bacterium]